jgi:hypothetical protein
MVRIDAGEPRRVALQQKLSLVLRDIEAGARKIAKQREIIAKLDARGYDKTEAIRKLANFEREHALTVASHRQIMRELTALGQVSRQHRIRRVRPRARKHYPPH